VKKEHAFIARKILQSHADYYTCATIWNCLINELEDKCIWVWVTDISYNWSIMAQL
jgi:hypothetical protein